MPSRCYEFVDSRLHRSPPDRASAVPYGQAGENAMRFPRLAHRSAAAHKLHSTPQQDGINLISGNHQTSSRLPPFSLFLPGSCPNNRDHRYLSYSNRHADLLFELISRRYEQKSTLVTTNRPFAEWREVFPNAACVVSLVDRLLHKADIIAIEGESYRLKEARERSEQRAGKNRARS